MSFTNTKQDRYLDSIRRLDERIKSNHFRNFLLDAFSIILLSALLYLSGQLLKIDYLRFAALLFGIACLGLAYYRFSLIKINTVASARKLDAFFRSKELFLSLYELTCDNAKIEEIQRRELAGIITKQITSEIGSKAIDERVIEPYVPGNRRKKTIFFGYPVGLLILALLIYSLITRVSIEEKFIGSIRSIAQQAELTVPQKEKVEELIAALQDNPLESKEIGDAVESLEAALNDKTTGENFKQTAKDAANNNQADKQAKTGTITPSSANIPPTATQTPTPTPAQQPVPKNEEEKNKQQEKSSQDKQQEQTDVQSSKSTGENGKEDKKQDSSQNQDGENGKQQQSGSSGDQKQQQQEQQQNSGDKGEGQQKQEKGSGAAGQNNNQSQAKPNPGSQDKNNSDKNGNSGSGMDQLKKKLEEIKNERGRQQQQGNQQGSPDQKKEQADNPASGSKQDRQSGKSGKDRDGQKDSDSSAGKEGDQGRQPQSGKDSKPDGDSGKNGKEPNNDQQKNKPEDKGSDNGKGKAGDKPGQENKNPADDKNSSDSDSKHDKQSDSDSGAKGMALPDTSAKAEEKIPQDGGDGSNPGIKTGFQDKSIEESGNENLNLDSVSKEAGELAKNRNQAKPKTDVKDLLLSKPEAASESGKQRVPLEYKDIL